PDSRRRNYRDPGKFARQYLSERPGARLSDSRCTGPRYRRRRLYSPRHLAPVAGVSMRTTTTPFSAPRTPRRTAGTVLALAAILLAAGCGAAPGPRIGAEHTDYTEP